MNSLSLPYCSHFEAKGQNNFERTESFRQSMRNFQRTENIKFEVYWVCSTRSECCMQCSITIRCLLFKSPYVLQNIVYIWRTFGHAPLLPHQQNYIPSTKIFFKIDYRFQDIGTLKPGGRIQHDDPDLGDGILHRIEKNLRLNTRVIAAEEGVSSSTVQSVLKGKDLHLCSFQKVHELKTEENFFKWMSRKIQRNSNFPARILFTNETTFNKCDTGVTNTRSDQF